MRFMLKFSFPTTEESNAWVRDGSIRQKIASTLEALQPEAAYFGPTDGTRGGYWVINIEEASPDPPYGGTLFPRTGRESRDLPCYDPRGSRSRTPAEIRLGGSPNNYQEPLRLKQAGGSVF
jgi:hypothetical protein